MAARRCSMCGINYPTSIQMGQTFTKCAVCDGNTDYIQNVDVDDDWKENVRRKLNPETPPKEKTPVPVTREQHDGEEYCFVSSYDLIEQDMIRSQDPTSMDYDMVLELEGKFWEIMGYDNARRRFWISEIAIDLSTIPETEERYVEEATEEGES